MKISTRQIIKALRLYSIANDQSSPKDLKKLEILDYESFVQASFVFNKQRYVLFFGSTIDDDFQNFWPDKPSNAEPIDSPLDETEYLTPFQGKLLLIFHLKPQKQRLDLFLATDFDTTISRSLWQKYIKLGCIEVNSQVVKSPKFEVADTDDIQVTFPEANQDEAELPVIFENDDVVIINKPAGTLTHAKGGINSETTVADFLRPKTTFSLHSDRPGIVHRLDRATSGVIIGARHDQAAKYLQQQFANRTAQKSYIAIVEGQPKLTEALIDLPIDRNPRKPSIFRVDASGKPAETYYKVIASKGDQSLLLVKPKTGRTHQIRVHLAYIGVPIVGDKVYGQAADRMYLHASGLEIGLPSGKNKAFYAPLPKEFSDKFPGVKLP